MNKHLFLLLLSAFVLLGCKRPEPEPVPAIPEQNIVILYENDVHCAIDGYAKFAALRTDYQRQTPYVAMVSAGDFSQGGAVGTMTKGEAPVQIMNKMGYDVVTLGNHEFDFGMEQLFHLTDLLEATVVCANFCRYPSMELLYRPYIIKEYGKVKVAYIGLVTPSTIGSSKPSNFVDESGNRIYDFMNAQLEEQINQLAANARQEGADYVVLLAHNGINLSNTYMDGVQLLQRTIGIDVMLDGHSHVIVPDSVVCNAEGKTVHYTSTGTKFQYMGVLTIDTVGSVSVQLVETEKYAGLDTEMQRFVTDLQDQVSKAGKTVLGHTDFELSIYDAEGKRMVRNRENVVGNLLADAIRAFFSTELAVINGGGVRETIKKGDITYNDLLAVQPFNNLLLSATITGQQLLDALEVCYSMTPVETGSFMQISGMRLTIDTTAHADIEFENDLFVRIKEGSARRVSNLEVYDSASQQYVPVDPSRRYSIASSDYPFTQNGCSGAFRFAQPDEELGLADIEATVTYVRDDLHGQIPSKYAATEGRILFK